MIRNRHQAQFIAALVATSWAAGARGQVSQANLPQAPSAILRPLELVRGVDVQPEHPGAVSLTLDEAIQTGLKNNAGLILKRQQERYVQGQQSGAIQALIPNLQASGYLKAQEIDLVALGFKPGSIHIPGVNTANIPSIVKVNTADAQLSLSQSINTTSLFLYKATVQAREATNWSTLNQQGGVVIQIGGLYLKTLADEAMVHNAEALVKQDQTVLDHAQQSQAAGVGIHLDTLRAETDLRNEEQALVSAQNAVAKDKVMLNRAMGQPAGQELELVDAVPYSDYNADSSDQAIQAALAVAYERRKDLRQLESQLQIANTTRNALKYERVPTVAFGGYYGVLGQIGGLYHGVFTAQGQVSIPIFNEAQLRGQKEVAAAEEIGLKQQIESNKQQIEADIRSSLLDVQSTAEVVKVARSNVMLAQQALSDATDRFTAGVDDSLPVERAQATLVGAQARVIQAQFNYNYAKLTLARNTGVVETQYRTYLGR